MGRPRDTAELIKQGKSPAQIAQEFGITFSSVKGYLWQANGERLIRLSDILYSIPTELRDNVELYYKKKPSATSSQIASSLTRNGITFSRDELSLYLLLRDARAALGDLYEYLIELEISLHKIVKEILVHELGGEEKGWWRKGIPRSVRMACHEAREDDSDDPAEPYAYTNLIHLKMVFEDKENWKLFVNRLPPQIAADRKAFLSDLTRLNSIRNRVMHPLRHQTLGIDDLVFVRRKWQELAKENWR